MPCFRPLIAYRIIKTNKLIGKNRVYEEYMKFGSIRLPKEYIDKYHPENSRYYDYEELELPCGKCEGCLMQRANDWATRCYCESLNWQNNCFITLTYNEENVPRRETGALTLYKKDLCDFWKRLRYYEKGVEYWTNPQTGKYENPIRYLSCGEYGEKTQRPHYHAIVFNWKPNDLKMFKKNRQGDYLYTSKKLASIWGKGHVIIGDVNYQTACYVSRYITKKKFGEKGRFLDEWYRDAEFSETSRNGGIGLKYWQENKKNILDNNGIFIKVKDKVKLKPITKYFKKKFKEEDEYEYESYMMYEKERIEDIYDSILKETNLNKDQYLELQHKRLQEKMKLLKRDNI